MNIDVVAGNVGGKHTAAGTVVHIVKRGASAVLTRRVHDMAKVKSGGAAAERDAAGA